jgi:hypothetical protein
MRMTAEQEVACREHIDAILEITSGVKLSTLFESTLKQMNLSEEQGRLLIDVIQKSVADSMQAGFVQAGEQLTQILNDPVMQAKLREQIDEARTPKGETVVEVPKG